MQDPNEIQTERLTHTVHVSVKKSDGNYGSTEKGFFTQFTTPLDASFEDIQKAASGRMARLEQMLGGK